MGPSWYNMAWKYVSKSSPGDSKTHRSVGKTNELNHRSQILNEEEWRDEKENGKYRKKRIKMINYKLLWDKNKEVEIFLESLK